MKRRVVCYVDPEWALGAIHHELSKRLWLRGISCSVLPWDRHYTRDEITDLERTVDVFLTNPHGWAVLRELVPPEKGVVVAHSRFDLARLRDVERLRGYGCVSAWLCRESRATGIAREPTLLPLGVNVALFRAEPSERLATLGFAGALVAAGDHPTEAEVAAMIARGEANPRFTKRGYLVEEIARRTGLAFRPAGRRSFLAMPGYYRTVDAVLCTSTEEGAGLPLLEASAAGRLVFSTRVGHFERAEGSGVIELPMGERDLVEFASSIVAHYAGRPADYRDLCYAIRERCSYDWETVLDAWAAVLG